jgi:nucleotidyltransferase/DNA polymerase involved in DNA repair
MLLRELHTPEELEEAQTWARSGMKVVRKYRCSAGPRKNRIVAKMAQCFAAPDIKKKIAFKRTKARLGKRMARKAKKTKRINPASRRVQALNKARRR